MIIWILLVVILLGLPMFIADSILQKKGYGWAIGTFLGFFLGWIGVIIALVMPYKPKDS